MQEQLLLQILENTRQIQITLAKHDKKFQQFDERFEQIDKRFIFIDQKFEQIDQRFSSIDQKFEQIDQRFERVIQDNNYIKEKLQSLENIVTKIESMHREKIQVYLIFSLIPTRNLIILKSIFKNYMQNLIDTI